MSSYSDMRLAHLVTLTFSFTGATAGLHGRMDTLATYCGSDQNLRVWPWSSPVT